MLVVQPLWSGARCARRHLELRSLDDVDGLRKVTGNGVPLPSVDERGFFLGTDVLCLPTPSSEATSGWRVDGAGHIALEDDATPHAFADRVGYGDGRQQRLALRVRRPAVDAVTVARLDDLAEVHDHDLVADVAHHGQVVRDEEVRQAQPVLQLFEEVDEAGLDRDIESETGSSSTTTSGSNASALAMPMRCRCPPENSCGNRLRCSGLSPTSRSSSDTSSSWFPEGGGPAAAPTIEATVIRGSSYA